MLNKSVLNAVFLFTLCVGNLDANMNVKVQVHIAESSAKGKDPDFNVVVKVPPFTTDENNATCVVMTNAYKDKTPIEETSTPASYTDEGYEFSELTGSWYKYYKDGETWTSANRTCKAEGAHLVIINSNLERDVIHDLHEKYEKPVRYDREKVAVGIYRNYDGDWMTVDDEPLEKTGFAEWHKAFPANNEDWDKSNPLDFGYFHLDKLENWSDEFPHPFICEKY